MDELFCKFVDQGARYIPEQMSLKLPKLKKVGSTETPKLKLPKLKKIEA